MQPFHRFKKSWRVRNGLVLPAGSTLDVQEQPCGLTKHDSLMVASLYVLYSTMAPVWGSAKGANMHDTRMSEGPCLEAPLLTCTARAFTSLQYGNPEDFGWAYCKGKVTSRQALRGSVHLTF